MDAKQYLNRVARIDALIESKQRQVEEWQARALSVSAPMQPDKVKGSACGGGFDEMIARIDAMQKEINADIDRLIDTKQEVAAVVDQVPDADQIRLLYMRYFERKTWEVIAVHTNFAIATVYRMHGEALNAVAKILKSAKK